MHFTENGEKLKFATQTLPIENDRNQLLQNGNGNNVVEIGSDSQNIPMLLLKLGFNSYKVISFIK